MTRESEKLKIRMSVIVDGKHINSLKKADEVIDKIFDEHEAQLKAKDEENERLKEAMQEFVSRVEKGEVRSSYTYSKFKELLKDNQ